MIAGHHGDPDTRSPAGGERRSRAAARRVLERNQPEQGQLALGLFSRSGHVRAGEIPGWRPQGPAALGRASAWSASAAPRRHIAQREHARRAHPSRAPGHRRQPTSGAAGRRRETGPRREPGGSRRRHRRPPGAPARQAPPPSGSPCAIQRPSFSATRPERTSHGRPRQSPADRRPPAVRNAPWPPVRSRSPSMVAGPPGIQTSTTDISFRVKRARLVGADERGGTQGLDRLQMPHQRMPAGHPLRTHRQRQRDSRQQAARHDGDRHPDREQEPVGCRRADQ